MREIVKMDNCLRIGASVTLMEMEEALREEIRIQPGMQKNFLSKLSNLNLCILKNKLLSNVILIDESFISLISMNKISFNSIIINRIIIIQYNSIIIN